jgi:predicted nucleotidyltransferase
MTPDVRATDLVISQEVTQRIVRRLGSRLRKIILFGSRARGEARLWSGSMLSRRRRQP